jgi:STE24 endopeptidase
MNRMMRVFLGLCLLVGGMSAAGRTLAALPQTQKPAASTASTEAVASGAAERATRAMQNGVSTAANNAKPFDVHAAVEGYLAKMPPERRAKSDSYFEGGYWIQVMDFVVSLVVSWALLSFGISAKMRDLAERLIRFKPLQTAIYWTEYIVLTSVVTFPITIYEGFVREKKYDFMNETFGAWFKEQMIGLGLGVVLGAILVVLLFGLVRKLGRSWWVWGAVVFVLFIAFTALIAPVYISPLFNKYVSLQDASVKDPILSMARANGIPATDVWEFDASRQSNRVSANVSGIGSTMRISLNDNLLKRCTLPEIETTMGHEMGHYVLNHIYKGLVMNGVVIVVGFAFLAWGMQFALARWGEKWGVRGTGDVAVLPLAVIVFSIFFFFATPINNTITRSMEFEADMYGLNAARQPDAEANVDLLLGEYRKMDPGPIEEFVFFDHPSGRTRITAAMQWKSENLDRASKEEEDRVMFPAGK